MTEKIVNRALKVRLYPTQEQKTFLDKSLGCSRFFYNYRLNEQIEFYKNEIEPIKDDEKLKTEKYKSFKATTKKQFKEKFDFAKECSDDCLNSTERNLQSAFNNFFKSLNKLRKGKMGFPKFRSKKQHKDSYTECHVKKNAFDFHNRRINISKCTPIYFKHREKLPKWYSENCELKSITISKNSVGEYWVSLLFELPSFYANPKPIDENQAIGLDWSPSEFYIDSECHSGKDYGYEPQKQKHAKPLAKLQRRLIKKTKGSNNYEKARIKLAKLEKHIADSRKWWIENESLRLTKNYSTIGIEDLNLQGIAKFLRNAKNINDCGYANFVTRLQQKGEEQGTSVIKVDRYFPSSQLCHCCGYQNHNLKLSDREWTCPSCGEHHIRDVNASINLKNEAIKLSVPMRRGEFRSVEGVEDIHLLALQALNIGASVETESGVCENPQKAYSL
jgi:putative transposase